jgi:hypothetical protein
VAAIFFAAACSSTNAATGGHAGSGGGNAGAAGGATGAAGTGEQQTGAGGIVLIGPAGGVITQSGVSLEVPANALPSDTAISIATTTAPAGYTLASSAYQFGPTGTMFAQPVTITVPLNAATPGAHLFWSNARGGFDDLGGKVLGTTLTGTITHFSIGFAAVPGADGGAPMDAAVTGHDAAAGTSGGTAGTSGGTAGAGGGTAGAGGNDGGVKHDASSTPDTGGAGGHGGAGGGGAGGGGAGGHDAGVTPDDAAGDDATAG